MTSGETDDEPVAGAHGGPDLQGGRVAARRNLFLDDGAIGLSDHQGGGGHVDGDGSRVLVIERVDRRIQPTTTTSRLAARAQAVIARAGFVALTFAPRLRVRRSPRIKSGPSAALASVLILVIIGTFVARSRVQSDRERARADAAEATQVIGGLQARNAALAQERDAACRAAIESARALVAARADDERRHGAVADRRR